MDTLVSLLPITLVVLVAYLVYRLGRRKPEDPLPVAPPMPEYKGWFAFFRRHVKGDYSLARSYWVNLLLSQFIAMAVIASLEPWAARNLQAWQGAALGLFAYVAVIVLWLWAVAGCWASSNKHVSRGGRPTWASLAKVAIILGALRVVAEFGASLPVLTELAQVALGKQHGAPTTVKVLADGRAIRLAGGINDGSAEKLEEILRTAPRVKTVVLASEGGWIREGRLIADVIRNRGLNTYVDEFCASACTLAFLAGADRAAAPKAKIGFHAARTLGGQGNKGEQETLRTLYRQAGLPEAFINRALDTPSGDMWFPSHEAMQAAGVITRSSPGGEMAAMASAARSRQELDQSLRKVDLFETYAQRKPAGYRVLLDTAWESIGKGATDNEITTAIRSQILPSVLADLPLSTESTLVEFERLIQDQLRVLGGKPEACVEFLYPTNKPYLIAAQLSDELKKREAALLVRIVREADESRRIRPTTEQVGQVARRAASRMNAEQVDLFFADDVRTRGTPSQICAAATAFHAGLGALPEASRGGSLRVIYSGVR